MHFYDVKLLPYIFDILCLDVNLIFKLSVGTKYIYLRHTLILAMLSVNWFGNMLNKLLLYLYIFKYKK